MNQNLLFPLVFWDGPPRHDITAITSGPNYVVTGAASGELCLWKMVKTPPRYHEDWIVGRYLTPVAVMVREGCTRVTALARVMRGWDQLEMIVSGSLDGSLTLWDSSGGRCHFSKKVLRRSVSRIEAVPKGVSKDRDLIVCFSRGTNQIHVIDLHTLSCVRTLTYKGPIADIAVCSVNDSHLLIALTTSGFLCMWDINQVASSSGGSNEANFQISLATLLSAKSTQATAQSSPSPPPNTTTTAPFPSAMHQPQELCVSPTGELMCVRFSKARYCVVAVPSLLAYAQQGGGRRSQDRTAEIKTRTECVRVREGVLEGDEERRIRESEGDSEGIKWVGCSFLPEGTPGSSDKKTDYQARLLFHAVDGLTRIVSYKGSGRVVIEDGPHMLRNRRVKSQVTLGQRASEEFARMKNAGINEDAEPDTKRNWEACVAVRVRAVGVGLRDADWTSSSDPYLQIFSGDELLWETEVVHNSSNPHWADVLIEKCRVDPSLPLRFVIFDKDEMVDDFLGALDVNLKTLLGMAKNCTLRLYKKNEFGEIDTSQEALGSLRFKSIDFELLSEEEDVKQGEKADSSRQGDGFDEAAGLVNSGRERALEATEVGLGVPACMHVTDRVALCAAGSGRLQFWVGCPRAPSSYLNLKANVRRRVREMCRPKESKCPLPAAEGLDSKEVSEIQQYFKVIDARIGGLPSGSNASDRELDSLNAIEEGQGAMSPVFWVGDQFGALQSNPCTSSVLAAGGGDLGSSAALLLARGYRRGNIVAASLLDDRKHITLSGHSKEVTCMVAIPPDQSPTSAPLLVSGSLDSYLCIWDLENQKRIGRFFCRSPILSLHWPQSETKARKQAGQRRSPKLKAGPPPPKETGGVVMGVTADHAVHVISLQTLEVVQVLQGHDSRVVAIYKNSWASHADYVITQTVTGHAYVWCLSTGHIDRILPRKEAMDFLSARQLLATSDRNFIQTSPNEVTLSSSSSNTAMEPQPKPSKNNGAVNGANVSLSESMPNMAQMSHRSSFSLKANRTSPAVKRAPVKDAKRASKKTSQPLMQVCNMGIVGGLLRANMFCLNVNRLIVALRTQYRHLSSRTARGIVGGRARTLHALLSYLFEWGVDPKIDRILTEQFGFRRPFPKPSFGVMSYRSRAVALLLPGASQGNSRWELCPTLTAIHSLSLSALCMTMLSASHPSKQVYYTQVVSHYGVHLPDNLRTYVEPSIEVLVVYSYNQSEEIHMASRLLLQGVIERSSVETLQKIVERWTSRHYFNPFHTTVATIHTNTSDSLKKKLSAAAAPPTTNKEGGTLSPFFEPPVLSSDVGTDRRLIAALVLCLIAADQQRKRHKLRDRESKSKGGDAKEGGEVIKLTATVVEQITETLLKVLYDISSRQELMLLSPQDLVVSSLAAELMGKGFFLWRRHVTDVSGLIARLHRLSLIKRAALAGAAHRALLQAGQSAPKRFIRTMGNEALNLKSAARCRSGALFAIVALVKKYPSSLIMALPTAVQIIIKCLDPSAPALRKSLLRPATAALHALVQNYPSVTFHQKSQRFAVGTTARTSSHIVIYDLRTATKWRILSGHTGTITAVSFNPSATSLASYAPDENPPTLRFWETGSSSFFNNLLGIQGQCIKTIKLPRIHHNQPVQAMGDALLNNRIVWISPKMVKLRRENGAVTNHSA